MKITSKLIEGTVAPAKGSVTLWDTGHKDAVRGFGARVFAPTERHPGGLRSFFVNYRRNGVERRLTIGSYPTWPVTAARAEAKELRQRIDRGEDPAVEKREHRHTPTVQDLIDRYVRDHLPGKAQGRRATDELRMLAEIGSALGTGRKVADVHYGDCEKLHKTVTASGRPVRANRMLSLLSMAFNLALRPLPGEAKPWRDAVQGNPCKGIPRNAEQGRERFFSTSELAVITEALAEYGGGRSAVDCIRLIMLCGCRPSEAMRAEWSQFDDEPGYWVKPATLTKQRKAHKTPLSPPAIELIERLRKHRKAGATWVFPGAKPGKPLHDLEHPWQFVKTRAGLEDGARLYDLRHSFASIGAGGGLSLQIVGKLLGHSEIKTTLKYAHLAPGPLQEAADRIGTAIANAGKASAEVVDLKKRAP
jgi:integrase